MAISCIVINPALPSKILICLPRTMEQSNLLPYTFSALTNIAQCHPFSQGVLLGALITKTIKSWELTPHLICFQLSECKIQSILFLVISIMAVIKKLQSATNVVSVFCIHFNTKSKAELSNIYLVGITQNWYLWEHSNAIFTSFWHCHLCYLS